MVALEALACGLPAICGRSGGIGQIIQHHKTGLLIEGPEAADAPGKFARAIEELLEAPGRLSEMSESSLQEYQSKHHLSIAAKQIKDAILPLNQDLSP